MTLIESGRGASAPGARTLVLLLALAELGCNTFGVKRAYMALDSGGERRREHFYTDTNAIFCVAELASGVEDFTVTAELRQLAAFSPVDGSSSEVDALSGVGEVAPGAGDDLLVAFELERPSAEDPYAAGLFRCDLSLNGEREEKLEFRIDYPKCPVVPVQEGVRCAGFVLDGASCDDASGSDCVCGTSGVWECS